MDGRRVRILILLLIPISILLFMAYKTYSRSHSTTSSTARGRGKRKLTSQENGWVESTLRKMSVDEKIGQLLFTTYHGSFTATDAPAYRLMMHDVSDLHVGGFIVITHGSPLGIVKSQAYPTAALINQLQAKFK